MSEGVLAELQPRFLALSPKLESLVDPHVRQIRQFSLQASPEASFHGKGAALDAFEPELFGTAASLLSLGDGQLRNHGTFLRQTDTRGGHS